MKKRYLFVLPVLAIWIGLSAFSWLKPANEISQSERRKLDQFPSLSVSSLLSGSYMEKFDAAATDQFPLRETFRKLRAGFSVGLFGQLDSHGIVTQDGYLEKLNSEIDQSSLQHAAERIQAMRDTLFPDAKVWFAVIPEKSYYFPQETGYPFLAYDDLIEEMQTQLPFTDYIDLTGTLSLESYFKTDSHWRQEALTDTASALADNLNISLSGQYRTELMKEDFHGVYAGQSALPVEAEPMYRLTNDILDNCTVYNHETGKTTGLWDYEKLSARDPYDVYLSGASSLLTIENPAATHDRELIVFRDSFGSSLVPLLAEGYRTITVADTRYIHPELLPDYVDFTGKDVLLLYSTGLLNQSSTLR